MGMCGMKSRIDLIGLNGNDGLHYEEIQMKKHEADIQRVYNILSHARYSLTKQRKAAVFSDEEVSRILRDLDEAAGIMYGRLYPELREE